MIQPDNRPALNVLRGFAAVVVVIYHFRYFSGFAWFENVAWVRFGFMGVDFFFLLSGLIISHVYLQAMEERRESYRHFLYLRIARIFPVHFLIMAVMLAAALLWNVNLGSIADWFSLTFLFRQILLPDGYVWNTPAWSVSAEMFAYAAVFPLIVHLAKGRPKILVGAVMVAAGVAVLSFLHSIAGTLNATNGTGPLMRVTGSFVIGSGLYCLLAKQPVARFWDYAIVTGMLLLVLSAQSASQPAMFASLALITLGAYMSNGPVGSVMSRPIGHLFGEVSFSLYMCHVPLLMLFSEIAVKLDIYRGVSFCAVSLACALGVSWGLYRYVEVPARSALRERWRADVDSASQPAQPSAVSLLAP